MSIANGILVRSGTGYKDRVAVEHVSVHVLLPTVNNGVLVHDLPALRPPERGEGLSCAGAPRENCRFLCVNRWRTRCAVLWIAKLCITMWTATATRRHQARGDKWLFKLYAL